MRYLSLLGLLLLCALGRVSGLIVLIDSAKAGPDVDPATYYHAGWIRWPVAAHAGGLNRLLSIVTGVDWQGHEDDFEFRGDAGLSGLISRNFGGLTDRGHFDARLDYLDGVPVRVIPEAGGAVPREALLLGLDRTPSPPLPESGRWPADALLIAHASDWDRVAELVRRADRRALVIEFPPRVDGRLGRFWLRGDGWPEGIPTGHLAIPGLIEAREVGRLALSPVPFEWSEASPERWGGVYRWWRFVKDSSALLLIALGILTLASMSAAVWTIGREQRSRPMAGLLRALWLAPASLILGGAFSRWLGLGAWPIWHLFAWLLLWLVGGALEHACRKRSPGLHPYLGDAIVAVLVTTAFDARWTVLSEAFGATRGLASGIALGAWAAYWTALAASVREVGRASIFVAALVVLAAASKVGLPPLIWAVPLVAAWIGVGWFRPWQLFILPILSVVAQGGLHGLAWAPHGLISRYDRRHGLDVALIVQFLASPLFLVSAFWAAVALPTANRFFFHELRRLHRLDSRSTAPLWIAPALALVGLTQPVALFAAVVAAILGALLLFGEALRTV